MPRRRRALPWTAAVIVVAVAIVLAWIAIDGHDPALESPASAPVRPAHAFPLTVTYVFDGDTIEARVVAPNEIVPTLEPVRVRLIGIDTPEGTPSPECWADEARDHLRSLVPEGSTVWATADADPRDRYDRALLYLWTDDGRFVNHELVAAGDAEAMPVDPNGAHHDLFTAAQASARAAGIGQWGACG
jgi:micrococcal nuclease